MTSFADLVATAAASPAAGPFPGSGEFGRLSALSRWWRAVHEGGPLDLARVHVLVFGEISDRTERDQTLAGLNGVRVSAVTGLDTDPLTAGAQAVDQAVDEGCDLLVLSCASAHTAVVAGGLLSALTRTEPVKTLGFDGYESDDVWMDELVTVRDLRHRAAAQDSEADALRVLDAPELSAAAAAVLRSAARRTPAVLDGSACAAAAVVASRALGAPSPLWQIGSTTGRHLHTLASQTLGLTPLLDLAVPDGVLTASILATRVLAAATAVTA